MRPMKRWIEIVAISQGPEGVPSSVYIGVCLGSGDIPLTVVQLLGKGDTEEEEVEYNIPPQEEERSIS